MIINKSIIPNRRKKSDHISEKIFKEFIKTQKPELKAIRGLPDFMIVKNREVVAFVEVKRDEMQDILRDDQELFKDFCRKNDIPYQVWSPLMKSKWWKTANNKLKRTMVYGEEIWTKI